MELDTLEAKHVKDYVVKDVILGPQAIKAPPTKILSEAEKLKWSLVSWSSTLSDAFKRS